MQQVPTNRLFTRFIALLLPVFLIASAVGLVGLSLALQRNDRNSLAMRIGNASARASAAISRLGSDAPRHQIEGVLSLLLADPAILCAELAGAGRPAAISVPAGPACRANMADQTVSLQLRDTPDATLRVSYSLEELNREGQALGGFSLLALLVGAVVAGGTSWLAFRLILAKPIGNLLAAIEATERTGVLAKAADPPDDELGLVIRAFNGMQDQLAAEAVRNTAALRHLDRLYNETPALMFTLAGDGTIQTVSGHLLDMTGYARHELSGRRLSGLVAADGEADPAHDVVYALASQTAVRDLPLRLICKNGRQLHVLLSSIVDHTAGAGVHLCVMSDVTGLREAQSELHHQAVTDHLTGLLNRKGLFQHLAGLEPGSRTAVLFIDLDKFKTVNDTLGHEAGDTLLRAAAARIRNSIQGCDVLARLGGDEFALVIHEVASTDSAVSVADRILVALAAPFQIGATHATIGASIGIASLAGAGTTGEEALRLADLAMYKSKQSGRNCVSVYTPDLDVMVMTRDRVTKKLREALRNDHLRLFLQPIVDLATLRPIGAEALLRLQCPQEGLIPPGELIRVAEDTGFMPMLGDWIVTEGLRMASVTGPLFGPLSGYVAINLSPTQLDRARCEGMLRRLQSDPGLASRLVFEITETAFVTSDESVSGLLADLRRTGARVALDDFGTGYSTLGHLQRFDVDILKIDRSFLLSLAGNGEDARRSRALVRATATLAADLGIQVVAEGIEDMATLEALRAHGVRNGQGYLFSRPLPLAAFGDWMRAFGAGHQVQGRRAAAS